MLANLGHLWDNSLIMEDKLYFALERVSSILKEKGLKIAVAESCTGGLLSSYLTDIPGSSEYFLLGVVVYNSLEKERILSIRKSLLKKKSPVSAEVAALMAENVRKKAQSDVGVGITGYAGPTGGTIQNPVGTVYISMNCRGKNYIKKLFFKGARKEVKEKSILAVMELIIENVV